MDQSLNTEDGKIFTSLPPSHLHWASMKCGGTTREAGHGKGAVDGVGAAVKRLADAVVFVGKGNFECQNNLLRD